jgi:hypothetical protein
MKTCPQCGTQYSDDTLAFCLQDGAPLDGSLTDTPTVVLGKEDPMTTRRDPIRVPIGDPATAAYDPGRPTNAATFSPPRKSSKTLVTVAITAVIMLLLFGVIGLAALMYYRRSPAPAANETARATNTNAGAPPSTNASPARTAEAATPKPTATKETQPDSSSYPATTRLKFARGSFSTSFSGNVNPGDSRSLVLSCSSGQTLSANISSANGCVTFRGGSSSMSTTTDAGDNFLTVSNHCSGAGHFSIKVSVF